MRLGRLLSLFFVFFCVPIVAKALPIWRELPALVTIDPLMIPSGAMTSKDDLLGKHIQEVIQISNIKRVLIIRNETSAPGSIHLEKALELIKCNVIVDPVPGISLVNGRYDVKISGVWPDRWDNIMFTVLLEMKDDSIYCVSRTPLGFRILSRHSTGILRDCD